MSSDKVILVPGGETFSRIEQHSYFEEETGFERVWEQLRQQKDGETATDSYGFPAT